MTPVILLDNLEEFVKEKTKDIKLQVRVRKPEQGQEKERAADVYKMRLPLLEDGSYLLILKPNSISGSLLRPDGKSAVYPAAIPDRERRGSAGGKHLPDTHCGCDICGK